MNKEDLKIVRVPIPTPTLWPHTTTNSYLVGNEKETILIDAGYDQPETKAVLEQALIDHELAQPKSIILTHFHKDHAPGVLQLTEWEATIFCHTNEKDDMLHSISPLKTLKFLEDGDQISVANHTIQILHCPGHTSGQLNLYIPATGILIAGDNFIEKGTSWIGTPDGNVSDYLQTLNRLKELIISKIGPGHGDWLLNPYEHIDFVIGRRLQREEQIKSLLQEHGPLSAESLAQKIYQDHVHPSILEVAKRTTEAHLIKLEQDGLAFRTGSDYQLKD
ncbi:MBL fold metallo-hydrolase [Cytobacillus purgationiresistens]|uniref:Glyoxylase-like metal-dependent hydrolase (Beta-lactamase superfamily II) n=1 Tax=Cytobacillus purgationiresistens TaxID=863449 RepID=A0ABU0AGW0_9BACI|nr:MBL fold metallo-hydrolase [Cytobacillus purgationiresistens]MDQ0269658.1 glyoxylase-like metal-dependent hydrolase (beta-lactamase superfamily II) [Cytobacillus purgationiresistens]